MFKGSIVMALDLGNLPKVIIPISYKKDGLGHLQVFSNDLYVRENIIYFKKANDFSENNKLEVKCETPHMEISNLKMEQTRLNELLSVARKEIDYGTSYRELMLERNEEIVEVNSGLIEKIETLKECLKAVL